MAKFENRNQPVEKVPLTSVFQLLAGFGTIGIWLIAFGAFSASVESVISGWMGLALILTCFTISLPVNSILANKRLSRTQYKGVLIATLLMYVPFIPMYIAMVW